VPFWMLGYVSFARNDNPTPANVKLCESPGRAGGLPKGQLNIDLLKMKR
jgi:hypothetical protein